MFTLESVKDYLVKDLDLKEDDTLNKLKSGMKNVLNRSSNIASKTNGQLNAGMKSTLNKTSGEVSKTGNQLTTGMKDTLDNASDTLKNAFTSNNDSEDKNSSDDSSDTSDNKNSDNKDSNVNDKSNQFLQWTFDQNSLKLYSKNSELNDELNKNDQDNKDKNATARVYYIFNYLNPDTDKPIARVRYAELTSISDERKKKLQAKKADKDYWDKTIGNIKAGAIKVASALVGAQLGGFNGPLLYAAESLTKYYIQDRPEKLKDKKGKKDKIATDKNYNVIEFPTFEEFKNHALYANNVPANLVKDFENRINYLKDPEKYMLDLELRKIKQQAKVKTAQNQELINQAKQMMAANKTNNKK